jgi:quinol monooxygenase YgiN
VRRQFTAAILKGYLPMVIEIAQFTAQLGKAEELRRGLLAAMSVIRRGEGCRSIELRRCVEDPDVFIYEIAWETLEHHTVTFRGGPLFPEYRSHITGLFVEPVNVRHYHPISG